jgi:hypothetical protein
MVTTDAAGGEPGSRAVSLDFLRRSTFPDPLDGPLSFLKSYLTRRKTPPRRRKRPRAGQEVGETSMHSKHRQNPNATPAHNGPCFHVPLSAGRSLALRLAPGKRTTCGLPAEGASNTERWN